VGVRVRRGTDDTTAVYPSDFTVWEPLDDESEHALAQRFAQWLRDQRAAAESEGGTLRVFHWTSPEWSNLKRILSPDAVRDLIGDRERGGAAHGDDGVFTDLEKVFKNHFTALRGTSIKKASPPFDFHWRAADPGGAISRS
jgi:hypothetical protein